MSRRFWIAFVVVFLAFFLMDWLVHGVLLSDAYEATASAWRTEEEMKALMPIMHIGTVIYAFFFVLIFGKGYEGRGTGEGLRFGLYVGLMVGVPMGLGTYASVPITAWLAGAWIVTALVENMVAGLLAAALYRPTRA